MSKKRTVIRYRSVVKPHHKRKGFTLPVAVVAGLAVPAMDVWQNGLARGDFRNAAVCATAIMTGYNVDSKTWEIAYLRRGLLPVLAGFAAHKIASKLGINRAIAQAGVPFIRI